jgi:fatty acid desaturase
MIPVKSHYYSQHAVALRAELGAAISRDQMRALHQKTAWRHFVVAARQFAILALATWGLIRFENPLIWLPLAFVQGLTIFDFTILLHEVVHHTIFERRRPVAERVLGLMYAIPSGISASQFTRWHLDHHAELGSDEDDPKRHHLSPKVNKRWYKLLYCTPALFPIYFRAARRESSTYPVELQHRIGWERKVSIAAHLTALAALWYFFGFYTALRTSIIPVFFVFPIAFTLNRLGQHYDIDPNDPAKWGTLMKGHWFWDFAFLNSNYHLEHHYFPGVPFYRLPALQRALIPFFERKQMRWQSYGRLVYGWLVENHAPHTDWSAEQEMQLGRGSVGENPIRRRG